MGITVNNSPTSAHVINVSLAVKYLQTSQTAAGALANSNFSLTVSNDGSDNTLTSADGSFSQVTWDPHAAHQVYASDGTSGIQSPSIALLHEIAHVLYGSDEAGATAFETIVAKELGEPVRAEYNANYPLKIYVENPSEHTEYGMFVEMNLDGTYTSGGTYTGGTTAYRLGWGTGSSGGGGGSGLMYQNIGGIDIIGSTQPPYKKNASHWQKVNYSDDNGRHSYDPNSPHGSEDVVIVGQPVLHGPDHF